MMTGSILGGSGRGVTTGVGGGGGVGLGLTRGTVKVNVSRILGKLGVRGDALRREAEAEVARLPKVSGAGGQYVGPRLKAVLDAAWAEAERLKDDYCSTEHLLVALAQRDRTGEGLLVEVPMVEAALQAAAGPMVEHEAYGVVQQRRGNEGPGADPQGVYGRSKLEGERAVAAANPRHVILRTAWVYSPFGKNFVKTMLALASQRYHLRIVADQWGNPTAAADIADGILRIAKTVAASGPSAEPKLPPT